jgi:hypothetical protein
MFRNTRDWKFDIQFFGEEGGGEGGKPEPKPEPKPKEGDPKPNDKTFTQAELDKIVADRLTKERKKYEGFDDFKDKARKLDELEAKKLEESGEFQKLLERERAEHAAELEKQKAKLAEIEANAKAKEIEVLRVKIASEKGISVELADRLRGNTEEELRADAEAMSAFLAPANPEPPRGGKPIGAPGNPPAPKPGALTEKEKYEAGAAKALKENEANRKKGELLSVY